MPMTEKNSISCSLENTKPRSDLAISRGLGLLQLRSAGLASSQIALVAGRSPGSTAAGVNRSGTVGAGVGADSTHGGSTAGGGNRGGGTGHSRRSTADGGGSRTGRSDSGGAAAVASTNVVGDHGGSTADPGGSGTARVNSGGSAAGDRGGSRTGRGGSTGRPAATVASTESTQAAQQAAARVATGVALRTMALLLAALRASGTALRLVAAARSRSGVRGSRSTAAGRGGGTSVAGGDFSNSGTHEQNRGRESCPLHVWYYSWKGKSGTETVANPRDTGEPNRNQPFAGRRRGCRLGDLNLTPNFSSSRAVPHHAKELRFDRSNGGGTVVSNAPRFRGICDSHNLTRLTSRHGLSRNAGRMSDWGRDRL